MAIDVLVDDGHRRFRQDRGRGIDDLEFVAALFFQRQLGLVFPAEQHVADPALHEGGGRTSGAGVENGHVLV